jgi:cytochrome b subunit of formate dehydrogenase
MAAQSEIPPAVAATDDDISSPAVAAESSASGSGEWDKPECDRLDDVSIATVITATVITIVITIVTGIVIIVFVAVLFRRETFSSSSGVSSWSFLGCSSGLFLIILATPFFLHFRSHKYLLN